MLSSYRRHQLPVRNAGADEGVVVDEAECYNPFYGIAVVCVSVFLFCVLAASVAVWKALGVAALAVLLLGVAGCFAPKGWLRRPTATTTTAQGAASAELVVTVMATASPARPGYACARVDAPPAFAFQCGGPQIKADGGRSEPAAAAAAAASGGVVCSVCLEDVRGGEMVRQVPACRHVFHVGCIDMWLHSHGTCPMCRCVVVSPPPSKAVATSRAPAELSADGDELPPV